VQSERTRFGFVANAHDLELLAEPLRYSRDHVGNQGPRQAMKRFMSRCIGRPADDELIVLHGGSNISRESANELTFWPLHSNRVTLDRYSHALRNDDWQPSNTRHGGYQTRARSSPPV
jgi:hypothetical protein